MTNDQCKMTNYQWVTMTLILILILIMLMMLIMISDQ